MTERPNTTVRYRVLVQPNLGTGTGNTVYVGLDVADADQLSPLIFDGLPKRIAEIRRVLDGVRACDGQLLDTRSPVSARDLHSVVVSSEMKRFAPELIAGAEILEL